MTPELVVELFQKAGDAGEYIQFDRVENKRSQRPDVHAFLLLDEIVPGVGDMVVNAQHDMFYLGTDIVTFCARVTEEQIIELVRCGVLIDDDADSLSMLT